MIDLQRKFAQIEHHAERVFKLLDKDNDGTIAGNELAALAVRVQREMWTLKNLGVIGGTTWLGPVPGPQAVVPDRDAITLPQFTAAFLATAIQLDGEIREQRMAYARMRSGPVVLTAGPIYYITAHDAAKYTDRYDRDENAAPAHNHSMDDLMRQHPVANYGPATVGHYGGGESHHGGSESGESHHHNESSGGDHHHGK